MSKFIHGDCMDGMAEYADNHFDLAITDPPYGIGASNDDRFGVKFKNAGSKRGNYKKSEWDNAIPDKKYFDELIRVSKNQIIWGVNYYSYNLSGGRIIWHKKTIKGHTSSDCEIAYKSIGINTRYVYILWNGAYQPNMKEKDILIHPTQKPVELYRWLLKNYAKKGDLILDTHVGSASSLIACEEMGFQYVGYELDKDYYESACKRLKNHSDQTRMI